jgi:hypothetical protein
MEHRGAQRRTEETLERPYYECLRIVDANIFKGF